MKNRIISVRDTEVAIITRNEHDYISLTDMVRNFDGGSALIEQWLKNKDTVLFVGVWEQLNNPGFNSLEFEGIKNEAGCYGRAYTCKQISFELISLFIKKLIHKAEQAHIFQGWLAKRSHGGNQ